MFYILYRIFCRLAIQKRLYNTKKGAKMGFRAPLYRFCAGLSALDLHNAAGLDGYLHSVFDIIEKFRAQAVHNGH